MSRRDGELVPVAEFAERSDAERVWAVLEEAGIPSSVVTDPEGLGRTEISRVWVERTNVDRAAAVVAEHLAG